MLLCRITYLINLPSERATLRDLGLATSGSAKSHIAATNVRDERERFYILSTQDGGLGVREDGCDLEASRALDIEEVAVRRLHESLELVGALLMFGSWVKQIELHNFGNETLRGDILETRIRAANRQRVKFLESRQIFWRNHLV